MLKHIFIFLILINIASSLDSQTFISCGGDDQTIIMCLGDNQNSFFGNVPFSVDTSPPIITLISPLSGSEDTDGIVNFEYSVSDSSSISSCSLYLDEKIEDIDLTITKNTPQTFTIINIKQSDLLLWLVSCSDSSNNIANSSTYYLDTHLGGSGTPAGGSSDAGIIYNNSNINYNNTLLNINNMDSSSTAEPKWYVIFLMFLIPLSIIGYFVYFLFKRIF